MKNKLSPAARREENWGWIMVAPTIIGLIVLNLWPFVQTIYTSFCEHLGFGHYKFVGLANYAEIFQTPEFWKATWNTILFCILTVPVGLFLSLLVAMLLNAKIKFKGGFRTIFFLPMVCAPAAVTMVWRWIFNGEYGILNQVLGAKIGWITDPNFVMVSCAVVAIWSNIGYDAVLLLAGLQNISKSYYEAASIDGAGRLRRIWHVTLPGMRPTIVTMFILAMGGLMSIGWEKAFLLQTPLTYETSDIISTFVYRKGFEDANYSYSTAVGLFNSIINLILVTTANRLSRKFNETSLW